jgi:hypothetical protein
MSVGGDLNAYAASTIGVSFANPLLFFGNGKNITVDGAMFVDSLGANGLTFNAGTSGSFTVSGTSTILKVEGTTSNATTTFNGQAKNITLTNGLNIQKGSSALGEVFFTPSTGTNAYDLTINKPSGYLSLATTSTVTGGLTVTAGTLYVNGTTTVTGDISNSDTIITNYPLKKSASGSLNASSYMLGTDSSLSVTLTDKNRNKIGTSTETISATIIAGNDSEAITLSETGVAAGVFTGSLSITSSANPNQNNGTLEVNAPGSITLSYADSDDNTDSVSVSATLSVPGGGGVPILFGTNIPIYIPSSSQTSSSSSLPFSNPSSETTSQNENTASLSLAKLAGPFSFGQTSEQVRLLQEYLSRDKTIYPEGKITGYYGPLTRAAVGKFQERYGLAKASDDFYGLAGPITRAKLNEIFGNPPESGLGGNNQGLIEELKKQIEILQNQVATLLEEKLLELQNKLSQ